MFFRCHVPAPPVGSAELMTSPWLSVIAHSDVDAHEIPVISACSLFGSPSVTVQLGFGAVGLVVNATPSFETAAMQNEVVGQSTGPLPGQQVPLPATGAISPSFTLLTVHFA